MGPQAETTGKPKRSIARRIVWSMVLVGGALFSVERASPRTSIFRDRIVIAPIRIEGVILDAQATSGS